MNTTYLGQTTSLAIGLEGTPSSELPVLTPPIHEWELLYPEEMVTHATLRGALNLAQEFNENDSPLKGIYLLGQFCDVATSVDRVEGYQGIFGTGYPFYALRADGSVAYIQEVDRYIETFYSKIDLDERRRNGAWICGACQIGSKLPDLKTICKPCGQVDFKPRDLFKALPDLDVWIVLDEVTPAIERDIEARLTANGYYTSDSQVGHSLRETIRAMQDIRAGHLPTGTIPLDLHLLTKAELMQCLKGVVSSLTQEVPFVPILPRSLRAGWEYPDAPYNFTTDFLLSMTEYGWSDTQLIEELNRVRRQARSAISNDPVPLVASLNSGVARRLKSPEVADALRARVNTW